MVPGETRRQAGRVGHRRPPLGCLAPCSPASRLTVQGPGQAAVARGEHVPEANQNVRVKRHEMKQEELEGGKILNSQ